MTASFTPCWKKHLLEAAGVLLLACAASLALAGSIEPRQVALTPDEQGLALSAEFAIDLGPRLEEAVGRGVPLFFRFEFTFERRRWYWADEHIAGRVLEYKLAYQPLSRQYRLSLGSLHQNFATLDEALKALSRVARLHVVDRASLIPGETYRVAVRLSLDHGQLPKPLQVDALADRDWRIEAKTKKWEFVYSPDAFK